MTSPAASPSAASGREQELGRLLGELAEVERLGRGSRVCLVRGPRGMGKSFLLSLFGREAAARGVRVLSGGVRRAQPTAYGLFADLVPAAVQHLADSGLPERELLALSRRAAPAMGHAARTEGADRSHEARRLDLFDAVADLFALAGRAAPVAVLLDEVDAADGASLDLLRYVLTAATAPGPGQPGSVPSRTLWVVAFRDEGPLPPALEQIATRVQATAVPLGGLDLAGLRAFLDRTPLVEQLLDTTGGVPERLEALLTASGGPFDLLDRRLGALPVERHRVLEILAVVGRPVEVSFVETVLAGLGVPAGAGPALEALAADRLAAVHHGGPGPRFCAARDAVREAALARIDAPRRVRLHGAVGEALARSDRPDPAEVAEHLLVSDPAGGGFEWSVRAGESLTARLAYGEAVEAYRRALGVLDDRHGPQAARIYGRLHELAFGMAEYVPALRWLGALKGAAPSPEAAREARGRAARVCLALGRPALAERLCRRVLGPAVDGDLEPRDPVAVQAFADLADAAWARGRYDEAVALARRGLAALDEVPEAAPGRLALRNTLGKLHLHRAEYGAAQALFEANAEEAERAGLPGERAKALNNLGVVAQRRGDRRAALDSYRASLDLRQGADRSREAFALQNIASLYHESGEFEAALDHYRRALSAFTRAGSAAQVARTACNLANLEIFLGDLEGAEHLSEHAAAMASEVGDPYLEGYVWMVRGDLARAREARASASKAYREALARFTRIASPRYAAETRLSLAALAVEAGEAEGARALLADVGAALEATPLPGLAGAWHVTTGEAALAAGDLEAATRALARAKGLYLDDPDLEGPVRLYHALGRLREAFGDAEGAEAHFARAHHLQDELAARVPVSHRAAFLALPRRRAILEAAAGREITPARLRRALTLEAPPPRAREAALPVPGLVGRDPKLLRLVSLLDRVAQVSSPVLVRGESGTGKELIADALHARSPRAGLPLVKVNCAAMHDELLLSELFGHEKGAFTGAMQTRKGRFELADGGTLFLDEIGDLSPKTQVALLRVLQHGTFERVGGTKTLSVDVRVIGATNRNLEQMIAEGTFREDLYYRLKGAMLELPPLRERVGDLPALVEHFLQKTAAERGEAPKTVSPRVMSVLASHPWPGNVRELENVVQSLSLFAAGPAIEMADLEHHPELLAAVPAAPEPAPEAVAAAPGEVPDFFAVSQRTGLSLKELKREVEVQCIRRALGEAEGNISEAARLLGMTRSRLSQIVNADEDLKGLLGGRQ